MEARDLEIVVTGGIDAASPPNGWGNDGGNSSQPSAGGGGGGAYAVGSVADQILGALVVMAQDILFIMVLPFIMLVGEAAEVVHSGGGGAGGNGGGGAGRYDTSPEKGENGKQGLGGGGGCSGRISQIPHPHNCPAAMEDLELLF